MSTTHRAIARAVFTGIFLLALMPAVCHADIPSSLKTYTVWNQFDATVRTFERIGLIMSDSRYQTLFFSIAVLGLIAGGVYATIKAMMQGHHPGYAWVQWLAVMILATIVYLTFIRPTTQITVYDETLNATKTVGGIPDGVAFIAGLSNVIENGLVDMIWTSGDPRSYRDNAGAMSFHILSKVFSGGVDLSGNDADGAYINMSIDRYFEDCVYFELRRPGTTLDINAFNTTTDFMPLFAKANNPAIYTVWFDHNNKGGATVTCQQAWTNLSNYLNSIDDTKFWNKRCSDAGYGTHSSAGSGVNLVTMCKNKALSGIQMLLGTSFTSRHIMRQILLAHEMWNVVTKYAPQAQAVALASRSAGSAMVGMGVMANEWIPIVRSVVFAVFVGMIPFLCLLLITPLFPRALSFMFGIFVFLTAWGICDALIHSFAMDKALDLFREVSEGNLGIKSIMLFTPTSLKTLAMFGAARWSAIMVAGVFSSVIARFGGSALAHFAGGLSALRQYGAGAGQTALMPEKWSSQVKQISEVIPTTTWANAGWRSVASAGAYEAERRLESSLGAVGALGGGNPLLAASRAAGASVTGIKETVAHSEAIREYATAHGMTENQVISAVQRYQTASAGDGALALQNLARDLHTDVYQAMDLMKDAGLKQTYGRAKGLIDAYNDAKADYGFTGGLQDYVGMQAEIESKKGYLDAAAIKKYGEMYRGGEAGFLKDQAEYRLSRTAGLLQEIRDHGATPERLGEVLGNLKGVRDLTDAEVFQTVGEKGVYITRAGEQFNEASKFLLRKWLDEVGTHGHAQDTTPEMLKAIYNHPVGRAQLRPQGVKTSTVVSPEQAFNFAQAFRKAGANVSNSDLSGATVDASLYFDKDGTPQISMLATKKGQKITEFDMREADYRRVQRGVKPGRGWWHGSFAGYQFVSGIREDAGNWVGQETVIHEDVRQGATYNGAAFMAEKGNVPVEVFRDEMKSAAFAMQYSKEWDKAYQGRLSKEDAIRVIEGLQAKLQGRINLPFFGANGAVGKSSEEVLNDREMSSTDVLTRAAMGINMSNMTVRQKEAAYQELNRMIRDIKTDKAEELPSASYMRHRGENPLGEIRTPNE